MDLQKRMKLEIEELKAALEKEKRLNLCLRRSVVWSFIESALCQCVILAIVTKQLLIELAN